MEALLEQQQHAAGAQLFYSFFFLASTDNFRNQNPDVEQSQGTTGNRNIYQQLLN